MYGKYSKKLSSFLTRVLIVLVLCVCLLPVDVLAETEHSRLYNQNDSSQWTSEYRISGCILFSFANAVYCLNGNKADIQELGSWAKSIGAWKPGSGGGVRDVFYKNVEEKFGSKYGFTITNKGTYSNVNNSTLKNHLKSGGVAAAHVDGHFIALVDYNSSTDKFFVIESYVTSSRGLPAAGWVTSNYLQTQDRATVDWFALIKNSNTNFLLDPVVYNDAWYAEQNVSVRSMSASERQQHWLDYGSKWGWQASPAFYAREYRELYPDLVTTFGTDDYTPVIQHFIEHGIGEWRSGRNMFSPNLYKENYSDLRSAFGETDAHTYFLHFVQNGYSEGRIADHRLQVYFDTSNGGSSSEAQRDWTAGTAIGTLPALTRDGYTGAWYTEKTGGTRVTADYICPGNGDFTVYAQWTRCGETMTSGYDRCVPDGDYMIVSAANPDKSTFYYMDIEGTASPAENYTNVSMCGPNSGEVSAHDIWTMTYGDDGFYTIKQKGTNVSLDLSGASVEEGGNIAAHESNGSDAQKWAIVHNGNDGYRIQVKASGFSVDIDGGAVSNGANIIQKSNSSSAAQSWLFIPYQPKQELANGRYILLSAVDNSLELDVPGDTADVPESAGLQIWSDTAPSRYNSFDVTKLDNGYYSIIHNASGKAVEVYGGGSGLGEQASLYTANGSLAQQWAITKAGSDGSYTLRVRSSGYALDLLGSARTNGSPVVQNQYDGSDSRKWKFVKAEYTVSYNANGGSNAPAKQVKYYNTDLTLQTGVPERTGYRFLGWSDGNASAGAADYEAGGEFRQNKNTTLYAVWEKPQPDLILPSSLTTVGEEAFEGGAFKYAVLPEGAESIEKRAFAECWNLRDIYIPESTVRIAEDAFEGVSELMIHGKEGSYAEFYAGKHGYTFYTE